MKLRIDGRTAEALPGQTLLEIVHGLSLDGVPFSEMPIAAKIAGDVFTLNYVPVRNAGQDPLLIRRAMEASGGEITLLRYSDPAGRDVYARTAQYLIFYALHLLYPGKIAKMGCTVGSGLFIEADWDDFSAEKMKGTLQEIVARRIPLLRRHITIEEAMDRFTAQGRCDRAALLRYHKDEKVDCYFCGDYMDDCNGELAPDTGYLAVWDIVPADNGFVFVFPDENDPEKSAPYNHMPHFMRVCQEGEDWGKLMECETAADLNAMTESGNLRSLIRINEALHEKRFSQIADEICDRGAKVVMLAGPSSSGKTTSANRLAVQLRVHGRKVILMSLDDYYADRDSIPPQPDGTIDLEHINTIDTALFADNLRTLLTGGTVELPTFNFLTGKREWTGKQLTLGENTVIIVEGLHALNPVLMPEGLQESAVYRMYVSPLLPLNYDFHNRIPTSYLRLLRRIVRDYGSRGASVQHTLSMWDSVRRGEKRWIFPYQESADVIFNSSTLYELAVLKKHIYPLLQTIGPEDACFDAVRGILQVLDDIVEADVDDEIPPTSLVREFIGGNRFYM